MSNSWVWVINQANKMRDTAYHAKNEKFAALWHEKADDLERKYLAGEPWLRTHDGKLQ